MQAMRKKILLVFISILIFLDVFLITFNNSYNNSHKKSPIRSIYRIIKPIYPILIGILYLVITPIIEIKPIIFCILCAAGDLILMYDNIICLLIGGSCFLVSHILMIIRLWPKWNYIQFYSYALMIPPIALFICFLYFSCKELDFINGLIFALYFLVALVAQFITLFRSYPWYSPTYILCSLGYFFFLISDYILLYGYTFNNSLDYMVEIMLTYIIALILIIIGVSLEPSLKQK